jgi:hypothetical protein
MGLKAASLGPTAALACPNGKQRNLGSRKG